MSMKFILFAFSLTITCLNNESLASHFYISLFKLHQLTYCHQQHQKGHFYSIGGTSWGHQHTVATSPTSKTAKFTFGCQSEENMLARSPQGTWQGQCFRYPSLQIGFKVLRENRYGPMEASMLHKCNRQINWRG